MGIYMWREYQWEPGENTLLYFPLTNNATDTQHNISMNAGGTVSYTTPSGLSTKCATFNGSSYLYNSSVSTSYLPQGTSSRTMSIWVMFTGNIPTSYASICGYGNASTNQMFNIIKFVSNTASNSNSFNLSQYGTQPSSGTYIVPQTNKRYNLTTTYDSGLWKLYVNGSLVISWSYTIATSGGPLYIWNRHGGTETCPAGYASNFIIENVARTAEEIANYYNGTKENYGL